MARLRTIRVAGQDGLKAAKFETNLDGVDVFAGPNGAGKSTRLIAVSAAARNLADTPTDALRDYLGPDRPRAIVDLEFADGKRLTRNLFESNKTAAAKQANGVAALLVGEALTRWDLGDFAASGDAARAELIERVCRTAGAAGSWDRDRVAGELRQAFKVGTNEPLPEVLATALHPRNWSNNNVNGWLAHTLTWTTDSYTKANGALTQAKKHAEGAQAEHASSGGQPSGSLAEARKRVEDLEAARTRAKVAIDGVDAAIRAAKHAAEDGERLAKAVADAEDAATKLREEPHPEAAVQRPDGRVEAEAAAATAATRLASATSAKAEAANALSLLEGRLATLRELADTHGGSVCRHCDGPDPLGALDAIGRTEADVVAAREALDDAIAAVALADSRARRAVAAVEALREQSRRFSAELQRVVEAENRRAKAIEAADARLAAANEALVRHQARLAEAPASDVPAVDVDGLRAEIAALDEQIAAARADLEAHVRYAEREKGVQKAVAAREKAAAEREQLATLGKALKALREKIASEAFAPIEQAGNELLTAAGVDLAVRFRSATDFGADVHGVYVPFWSLADSDRVLVAVAVAVAVARLMKAPWRGVLFDRFESVDANRRPGVLQALADLVRRDVLDNALVALVAVDRAEVPAIEGVTVHWLDGRRAAGVEAA